MICGRAPIMVTILNIHSTRVSTPLDLTDMPDQSGVSLRAESRSEYKANYFSRIQALKAFYEK